MSQYHDMDQITEIIWLGNKESAFNINELKKLGIKKVLSVIDSAPPIYDEKDEIKQRCIKIMDSPAFNIIQYFGECLNFISGEEKVLVHCLAGASRSATIVIAYLMWKEKMKYTNALEFVKDKRLGVFPNLGFCKQLKIFESLLEKNGYDINKINFDDIKWKWVF